MDVDMFIINKYPALLISNYEVDLSLIVSPISGYSISSRYRLECLVVANHHLNSEIHSKCFLGRSLKKFIFGYQDLVEIYSVSAENIISDAFSYSENV